MMYEKQVTEKLNQYKRKQHRDNLVLIPILGTDESTIGFLHPVTADFKATIKECVELLSCWRAENPTLSPTRFHVTHEGTERWINKLVVDNDQRILFMVEDIGGNYIGHMGFAGFDYTARSAEVDLVLRGKKNTAYGLMEHGIRALVRWGKQELGLKHIGLKVLWDNAHAISFYERCGFQKGELIPLTKEETQGEIRWTPHQGAQFEAEKYYLHMILC